MNERTLNILLASAALLLVTCGATDAPGPLAASLEIGQFNEHWYQGEAELNHYALEQARYGETHSGEAIMVFVTEDFLIDKQVKYEGVGEGQHTSVLKMNTLRRFTTGLYDYSMMRSVFTPVDRERFPHSLKATGSSQDWCGHSFIQLNLRDKEYQARQFSYFLEEGDTEARFPAAWLEDEVWTLLRIDPDRIPNDQVQMVPNLDHLRLRHLPVRPHKAMIENTIDEGGEQRLILVTYPDIDRMLIIRCETAFPYKITSWQETFKSGFGSETKELTTRATLDKSMMLPYWERHSVADESLRKEFGLRW